ncbi:MAG TPA: hypothetical protein VIK04_12335 [Solirubrobacteraceae bacterium]
MSEPPAVVALGDAREQRDDAYCAIGRYTVEFSLLVAGMREIIALHTTDEQKRDAAQLVLGSLMAQQVADPFFAICRAVGELDQDGQAIEKLLRKRVNEEIEEIEERNRIMPGDWLTARWTREDFEAPTAARIRVSARNVKEPVQQGNFTVAEIDEICERVAALKNVVWEFGTICTKQWVHAPDSGRPEERVRDALHIVEGRVAYRLDDQRVPWPPH